MRAIILALLVAAGIGFAGTANVSAAPANGAAIHDTATLNNPVVKVQHSRWRSRHWRHWCHTRRWSRWRRCW
jgi:hypothetical protein